MDDSLVLGIDPGTSVVGYGFLRGNTGSFQEVDSGEIDLSDSEGPELLSRVYENISEIMDEHQPTSVCVEEAFYGRNAKAALKLGEVRGVILLAASRKSAEIEEYAPAEIKKAVTGNGRASKKQVKEMIRNMLGLHERSMSSHVSDALAAGICLIHRSPF